MQLIPEINITFHAVLPTSVSIMQSLILPNPLICGTKYCFPQVNISLTSTFSLLHKHSLQVPIHNVKSSSSNIFIFMLVSRPQNVTSGLKEIINSCVQGSPANAMFQTESFDINSLNTVDFTLNCGVNLVGEACGEEP